MKRPHFIGSKAGRNEGRKLAATFLNNVGVAFALAAVLQPALAVTREGQPLTATVVLSSFFFAVVSAMLAAAAQWIARRLED